MKNEKSVYRNYSQKQIDRMEEGYFLILGGDFVFDEDNFIFNKKEINNLYNRTVNNLIDLIKEGSDKDRLYGIQLMGSLRAIPARVH